MPKISIIVPVYNTEKYLRKCLDSLVNQTLSDIEIICINDCSTDNSLEILRKYASKDNRIKVIDFKENRGAAYARNVGIEEAQGEYIGFIDSDDYPETLEFYEILYLKAKDSCADIVKGAYKNSDTGFIDKLINEKIKEDKNNFCSAYCSAIFSSKLIKENNIYFPELRDMEDPVFTFNCAQKANKIEVIDDLNVIITKRENSITKKAITLLQLKDKWSGFKLIYDADLKFEHPYVLAYWFATVMLDSTKNKNDEIETYIKDNFKNFYDKAKNKIEFLQELLSINVKSVEIFGDSYFEILKRILKNKIDNHDVISFDIFDTLLLRPFFNPAGVFNYIEGKYQAPEFLKIRGTTERNIRFINSLRYKDREDITYDMIYDKMPEAYKYFKDIELNLENSTLIPNFEMKEIFDYAIQNGKKVIITSDMYFSREVLEKFLKDKGFIGFSRLFVSSEIKKCKHTGNLFKYILKELNIKPEQMLHIGDNYVADVESPLTLGISAIHYKQVKEQFLDKNPSIKNISRLNLTTQNVLGLRILNWHNTKNAKRNYWEELGYNQGGPLAIAFLSNILEIIKYKNLTDLYFLARDGYLFKKLYDLIYNPDTMPKPHYAYATRKLKKMCIDNNGQVIENEQTYEYKKYLESIERNGNKVGLVDTCAGGFSAQSLIEKLSEGINYLGIYLVANTNFQYNYISLSGKTRFIIEEFMNWDIFEILFSSPEYPLESIKDCQPIFREKNDSSEDFQKAIYPYLEKGMLEFTKEYIDIFGLENISIDMENVFKLIINFWQNLSDKDKSYLSQISLPQDQDQTKYLSLIEKWDNLSTLNSMGLVIR